MDTLDERALHNLIVAVDRIDREGSRSANLGTTLRDELIAKLEAVLVDSDLFDGYVQAVQRVTEERVAHALHLPSDRENLILEWGLSILSDAELIRLALDTDALALLYDRIGLTDYWASRFAEVGRSELNKATPG